jgi:uncharacterized C2H2 Zn-finger protein
MKPCCVKIEKLKIPSEPNAEGSTATNPRTYECHLCQKISPSIGGHSLHMTKKHPKEIFFKCAYLACFHLYFDSEKEREKHTVEQHSSDSDGPKLFQCDSCNKAFRNRFKLNAHMVSSHGTIIIKCRFRRCETYFNNESDHQQHFEENHLPRENSKKCIYCGLWILGASSWHRHMSELHKRIAIRCSYSKRCPIYFLCEIDRDEHVKKVHLVEKIVNCIFCGMSYAMESYYNHMQYVHKGVAIKCSFQYCGKFFKTQDECDTHFKELHHNKEKSKNFLP